MQKYSILCGRLQKSIDTKYNTAIVTEVVTEHKPYIRSNKLKKKSSRPKQDSSDKARVELRLDSDLHEKLKQASNDAGISLNQLVSGLLRGCLANLVVGEPYRDKAGFVCRKNEAKCAFVGRFGERHTPNELKEFQDMQMDPPPEDKGEVWFSLDYTGRGYVPGR